MSENDERNAMNEKKESDGIEVLDDGAVRKDGRLLSEQEAEVELLPLGDALQREMPGGIADVRIHPPEIQAILDSREESPEKAAARAARLEKIALLLAESKEEEKKS